MNKHTSIPGREASWKKRTDTHYTDENPLQEKWKQQHPNYNQSDSLHKVNRPEQVILFRL